MAIEVAAGIGNIEKPKATCIECVRRYRKQQIAQYDRNDCRHNTIHDRFYNKWPTDIAGACTKQAHNLQLVSPVKDCHTNGVEDDQN